MNDTTVQFKEGSMVVVTCRRYLSSLKGKLYLGIEENPKFKMKKKFIAKDAMPKNLRKICKHVHETLL